MNKESKKVFLIGVVLSVISWWLILSVAGTPDFTPIYTFAIISAFFGLMFVLYGATNSGHPTNDEYYQERPWIEAYRDKFGGVR